MRRGLTWALILPLLLGGTEIAHALAYRLVFPQLHARVLAATGHAYLAWLPLVLGVTGALAIAALVAAGIDAARGRSPRDVPAWAFAAVPPLAFVLQEVLELSLHLGTFGWRAVLAPTFVPGLLLQLPLALAAYLVARVLVRAAESIGRALAAVRFVSLVDSLVTSGDAKPRVHVASTTRTTRGPPRLVAV